MRLKMMIWCQDDHRNMKEENSKQMSRKMQIYFNFDIFLNKVLEYILGHELMNENVLLYIRPKISDS